jgi:hypothetical protein
MTMRKSEKVHISVFLLKKFCIDFFQLFQLIPNQQEILRFCYRYSVFEKQCFFALFSTFSKLLKANAHKTAQKIGENFF